MTRTFLAALGFCIILSSGCGTIANLCEHGSPIYGGTRYDIDNASRGAHENVVAPWLSAVDLPFSFAVDTSFVLFAVFIRAVSESGGYQGGLKGK